jgi:two-component system invasion response regulator UvrY
MRTRILLKAEDGILCKQLKKTLGSDFGYPDIDKVSGCEEALEQLKRCIHSHIILECGQDCTAEISLLPKIRKAYPLLKIMLLADSAGRVDSQIMSRYGIQSYLPGFGDEVQTYIRLESFLFPEIMLNHRRTNNDPFSSLTSHEMTILRSLANGKTSAEIAAELHIASSTLSTYKIRIRNKTGFRDLRQLYDRVPEVVEN